MSTDTQCSKIIKTLKRHKKGVANYDLAQISLKYSSRIAELRKDGYGITPVRQVYNGRFSGVWLYYLTKEPA